ncbi:MAG: dihydroorotate dehydrogenase [Candidatus Omnitrophica bacterium]|nr:dihydroorotate dehydrogenase [Candidatus Omnitrophota bacterium]
MVDLSVNIGRLKLKNPVMTASGTFGPEYGELFDVNALGAVVLKTITLEARVGNPPPRIAETFSGMLNSIGLENKGLDDFIKNKLPKVKGIKAPIVVSIAGNNEREYALLAKRLSAVAKISALEINLSCPNVRHGTLAGLIAQDPDVTGRIVRAVRSSTRLPLIAKLTPNVTDISVIAASAEKAGADAVLLVNTFPAMAVDIETKKPKLGNITGGLSGPAIKPIALKMVWDVYNKVDIPIIGSGGIINYKDAIEFMLCGATAVQIGTAVFTDPRTPGCVIKDIRRYLEHAGYRRIKDIIGGLKA